MTSPIDWRARAEALQKHLRSVIELAYSYGERRPGLDDRDRPALCNGCESATAWWRPGDGWILWDSTSHQKGCPVGAAEAALSNPVSSRDAAGEGPSLEKQYADLLSVNENARRHIAELLATAKSAARAHAERVEALEVEAIRRESIWLERVRDADARSERLARAGTAANAKVLALEKERNGLRDALNRRNVLTCAYCGHEYPPGSPTHGATVLTDHIKVCPTHPLRAAEAENRRLIEAMRDALGIIEILTITAETGDLSLSARAAYQIAKSSQIEDRLRAALAADAALESPRPTPKARELPEKGKEVPPDVQASASHDGVRLPDMPATPGVVGEVAPAAPAPKGRCPDGWHPIAECGTAPAQLPEAPQSRNTPAPEAGGEAEKATEKLLSEEKISGLRPHGDDGARTALRELLAACIERSQGLLEGPAAHDPFAMCIICASTHDDPDVAELDHDKDRACGKAAALLGAK